MIATLRLLTDEVRPGQTYCIDDSREARKPGDKVAYLSVYDHDAVRIKGQMVTILDGDGVVLERIEEHL